MTPKKHKDMSESERLDGEGSVGKRASCFTPDTMYFLSEEDAFAAVESMTKAKVERRREWIKNAAISFLTVLVFILSSALIGVLI